MPPMIAGLLGVIAPKLMLWTTLLYAATMVIRLRDSRPMGGGGPQLKQPPITGPRLSNPSTQVPAPQRALT